MGLKMTLEADQNFMGCRFEEAYWKISNFGFGEYNGDYVVSIKLSAYPSREASILTESQSEVGTIADFGGSARPLYDAVLYEWNAMFPVSAVYPDGIPSDMDEAKSIAYGFIKEYLKNVQFSDVLEDGQSVIPYLGGGTVS